MQYHEVTLLATAANQSQWPDSQLPEVMFAGRSNAGKSTLINALVNRKNLAYTGKTPGKTKLLNFFEVDHRMVFCDSPGYGYAKGGNDTALMFSELIDPYMAGRDQLKALILVLDIRRIPNADDLTMMEYARDNHLPVIPVCMKADKLSRGAGIQAVAKIAKELGVPAASCCTVSGTQKTGIERVLQEIEQITA